MNALETFVSSLHGKPFLIYGLGRSGMATATALKTAGAKVVLGDDNNENLEKAKGLGFDVLEKTKYQMPDYAFLVLSPGIPLTHPKPHNIVEQANAADIEILCDIELFARIYPEANTIGVTGTNGKSTTSALIHYALQESGKKTALGGNIGTPVFAIEQPDADTWVVLEISSFQIDLCPTFRPDIAVILNLTPDHIDRHGTMENYCDVKEKLSEISKNSAYNTAIICTDDTYTQKIHARAKDLELRKIIEVSAERAISFGVYVENETLYSALEGAPQSVGEVAPLLNLKGGHNHQNIASAYATLCEVGLEPEQIFKNIEKFPGLNHRQFLVRTISGITYINDSKATNAASSAVALGCRENVYWIVGGRQKKNGIDGLETFFPRIKHAFLIGESTEDFASWFDKYGVEYTRCYDLEKATNAAHDMAQKNRGQPGGSGAVLLSPACASFDQFSSFEDRGNQFAELVKFLEE